ARPIRRQTFANWNQLPEVGKACRPVFRLDQEPEFLVRPARKSAPAPEQASLESVRLFSLRLARTIWYQTPALNRPGSQAHRRDHYSGPAEQRKRFGRRTGG